MLEQELIYTEALEIHHSILVKMKADLQEYIAKNPTLTTGQQTHVKIREQQILKLLEFQTAADQLIIELKAIAEQKPVEIVVPDAMEEINRLQTANRQLKYKLQLAEDQAAKQSNFLSLIGWPKSDLNAVLANNWKETLRDLSIQRAKEQFNF